MNLQKIEITGFGLFKDPCVITFEKPFYFIVGRNNDSDCADSNMSGKTTILHAIVWGLFGITPNELKKDSVINFKSKSVEVILHFDEKFSIRRCKERGKPETLVFGNNIYDKKQEKKDLNYQQKELDKIINISYKLFVNSMYIGRESKSLQFLRLTPAKRLEILEALFDGEVYKKAQPIINQKIKDTENLIWKHSNRITSIDQLIKDNERSISSTEQGIKDIRSNDKYKEIQELKNQYAKLEKQKFPNLDELNFEYQKYRISSESVNDKLYQHHNNLKLYDKILGISTRECPVCCQKIPESYIKEIKNKRSAEERLHNEATLEQQKIYAQIKEYADKIYDTREAIKNRDNQMLRIEDQLNSAEEYIENTEGVIGSLQSRIQELNDTIISLKKERIEREKNIKDCEDILKYYQFWHTGFSTKGIRSMLLDDIRNRLNYHLKYWLSLLADFATIEFPVTESGEFAMVLICEGEKMDIQQLSTGGAWRLNLAMLLSIGSLLKATCSTPLNFLLLDDLFGELDDTGIDISLKIIRQFLQPQFPLVMLTAPKDLQSPDIIVERKVGESRAILQ